MSTTQDTSAKFFEYAHPEKLVSTQWLQANLDAPELIILESNEDVLLYETGHIPGARKIDWHTDLNHEVMRDYLSPDDFAALASRLGLTPESTIVIYGDRSNWWAAYAMWVFELFGMTNVHLLDGGRDKWIAEGREITREKPNVAPTNFEVPTRDDAPLRAFRDDIVPHLEAGLPLIDVRSPQEYTGERTHMPDYPQESALRAGHIPGAHSVPWATAANEDGTFKTRAELDEIYRTQLGLGDADDVIAYCRIGERSSHTWFVLKYLLGFTNVRNYDGSWTEWGSLVGAPIVTGAERGSLAEVR
ncbi:sulfurtransferase [Gulosibacter bifidus]|uniref:Sulfurtransferase n=1 Tax=Gulosibacter bifidus TaxID=272239 RepID=A0ABW5RH79_9MICO|nr:sulfurtransferase [Gulosibacter bifidus]